MEKTFVITAIGDGLLVDQRVVKTLDESHDNAFYLYKEHKNRYVEDGYVVVNKFENGVSERIVQLDFDEEINFEELYVFGRV